MSYKPLSEETCIVACSVIISLGWTKLFLSLTTVTHAGKSV